MRAGWLTTLSRDVNFGLRIFGKNPGFSTVAIMTLALGIGATTAVFCLVNSVLLRPLPYANPQQLVLLWEPVPNIPGVPLEAWGPFNADFYDWKQQSHSFTGLALFTTDRMNLSINDRAVRVISSRVTGDFFQVLGIAPLLGRNVDASDDQPGKDRVAVISHALWQSQFGSRPEAVGKDLQLNAVPYRIIGVMPAGFSFPHGNESLDTIGKRTDVWIPWAMTANERAARDEDSGNAIARLRADVSPTLAEAELKAITARLDPLHAQELRGSTAVVRQLDSSITAASRRALLIFMGAVVLVLLIACGNVASLLLAHASGRASEMTIRTALGASRWRLIRQVLVESGCLAVIGGGFGVLIAYGTVRSIAHSQAGNIPRIEEVSIDWRVLLFTVCISLATAIAFGLFPALTVSQCKLSDALKSSASRTFSGGPKAFHRGLAIGEVALTVVLLAGSGLLIRSFAKLQSVDKGFSQSSTVTMNIQLDKRYNSSDRKTQFYRTLIDRTNAIPGVEAAGAISHLPLGGGETISLLVVEGHPFDKTTFFEERTVTPHYFAAMEIPLLEGRVFADNDTAGAPRVAVVSSSFAKKYFPKTGAIGRHFSNYDDANGTVSTSSWTIIGVVADVRQMKLEDAPPMQIYTPLWGAGINSVSVVARTTLPPAQLVSDLRSLVRDLDPTVAAADVETMNQVVSDAMAERRFETVLLTSFGGFALFLSLLGLYAILAYSVRQRTAEIGIRMALGAQRGSVMRMILSQGCMLALIGLAIGIGCAWILTRFMSSLLFEVKPLDGTTFFSVPIIFCAVALAACYIPAWRATQVDPMVALRYE